jgi:hypothetical protein
MHRSIKTSIVIASLTIVAMVVTTIALIWSNPATSAATVEVEPLAQSEPVEVAVPEATEAAPYSGSGWEVVDYVWRAHLWQEAVNRQAWFDAVAENERRAAEAARRAEEQRQAAATAASRPRTSAPATGDVWARLAQCESGGRNVNTGNGYYGYFQFSAGTWHSLGYSGLPSDHDYGTQLAAAQRLQARSGWGQWPGCARRLGLL